MKEISNEIYNTVKQQYLKQIEIPDKTSNIQYLLCPIGLVGAGKTTVVKPLAKRLNLVRISGDEIRKLFKERDYGYEKVRDLSFELINKFISEGYSVAIDSDCIEKIEKIKEASKKQDVKIIWIHINPPEEFIINKLGNLTPNWLGTAEEMIENYYQRKPLHQHINLDFTYVFDTSRNDLKKQIDKSAQLIQEKLGI